jgi:hypothetical protein
VDIVSCVVWRGERREREGKERVAIGRVRSPPKREITLPCVDKLHNTSHRIRRHTLIAT